MSTEMASIHRTIKKELWTVIKKSSKTAGGVARCLQDAWKWVTYVRGLCVWLAKKMQGCWPQYTQELCLCLPLCWWDGSGSRELWWPCLIRFSLCCLQPDRGWISCANKVDTHRCWWSHRTWLSYTPWMAHWGLELQWLPRQTQATCTGRLRGQRGRGQF